MKSHAMADDRSFRAPVSAPTYALMRSDDAETGFHSEVPRTMIPNSVSIPMIFAMAIVLAP